MDQFARMELLIGADGLEKLKNSTVAVFGLGGVGAAAAEALVRAGVGKLLLVDHDKVSLTNLNRQLIATHSTVGMFKTEAMANRICDINPDAQVVEHRVFYLPENEQELSFDGVDYIVDAIDTVSAKIALVLRAQREGVPLISCMGTGNKLHPEAFEVADIFETSVCPLCKVMRHELKSRGVNRLKVVYSKEQPLTPAHSDEPDQKRRVPGSMSFVPPVAGMILAGEVLRDLAGLN